MSWQVRATSAFATASCAGDDTVYKLPPDTVLFVMNTQAAAS
jgi:hypothetical protein